MKRNGFILTLLFLCSIVLQAQMMTVGTYNVRYHNSNDSIAGNGWYQRLPYICGLIRTNGFDIFGSQEVLADQLKDLLNGLPGYAYIGVGRDDGKEEGEFAPIFYKKDRFDLLKNGQFWLSIVTDRPNKGWDAVLPRICTWGKFRDKITKKNFWFFNLHMDHVGVQARNESSKLVLRKIKEMCGNETIFLTGDFNVDQTHENYRILNNSGILKDAYEAAGICYAPNGTFNNFDPNLKTDSRIDHIFVSMPVTVKTYAVLTDTYRTPNADSEKAIKSGNFPKEVSLHKYVARTPSDHFPVKITLQLGK
ncbi:endonuclease/exonuclease/phosphatase family protein [Coprobacter sp.]